jgi:hypothetical protein
MVAFFVTPFTTVLLVKVTQKEDMAKSSHAFKGRTALRSD